MLIITFYSGYKSAINFTATGKIIIGDILVETEFPFKGTMKLVTFLMVFSLIAWFTAIKIYELVYNFTIWNSIITSNLFNNIFDPNNAKIHYPIPEIPWNLYFTTQMLLAALIITFHSYYVMSKSKKQQ